MIQPDRQPTRLAPGEIDPVQPIDPTSPLARGLEGLWLPLPHLSGGSRLYDLSGSGRHGELTNMDPSTDWVPHTDPIGVGLRADETTGDERVHLAGGGPLPNDYPLTLVAAARNFGLGAAIYMELTSDSDDSGAIGIDFGRGDGDDVPAGIIYNDNGFDAVTAPSSYPTDRAHLVAWVCHASDDRRLFVNGERVNTGTTSKDFPIKEFDTFDANSLYRPDSPAGPVYFNGRYDLAAIYPSLALSDAEVKALHFQYLRGFPNLLRRRDESALYVSGTSVVTVSLATATAQAPAFDPTVSATANTIAPDTGQAAATAFEASITATQNTVSLGTAQAATTGFEPTITADANTIAPATGQAQALGFDPTISEGAAGDTLLADLGTAQAQGFAPSISTNPSTVTLGLGQASAEGFAPDVVADPSEINTGQGQAAATGFDPTVTTNARTVAPQLGTAQADGFEPAVVDGTVGVATTMEIEARPLYEIDVEAKPLYRIRLFVKERLP